jgi:hypothetical protein
MLPADTASTPQISGGWGAATPKKAKKVVRLRLDTASDVQRALARLIRKTLAGDMETQDLSRLANALSILGRLIEGGELEKRLEALESQGS